VEEDIDSSASDTEDGEGELARRDDADVDDTRFLDLIFCVMRLWEKGLA
jgi:hypothetical protein